MIVKFITLIVHYEMWKTMYDFGLFGLDFWVRKGDLKKEENIENYNKFIIFQVE